MTGHDASDEPQYRAVWPLSRRAAVTGSGAGRLGDLRGRTVCEIWDMNFRGDEIFPLLRQQLAMQFPGLRVVDYSHFGNYHGPGAEAAIAALPGQLQAHGCEAAIIGLGACGGCTPATMRVAAVIERLGIPTVSLVTSGFLKQAQLVARGLGMPLEIAEYPGHPTVDSADELRDKILEITAPAVAAALVSRVVGTGADEPEPAPGAVVATGSLDVIQEHFERNLWTDGLPIVPPTPERVQAFLRFTDRAGDEVLAVVPVEGREATVQAIAVNGVMAGCRPEYMPLLIATVQAMCDPVFRLQSCGTTPGWEPLVIVGGAAAQNLGFHHGQGVMRLGHRPNTTLARFVRLFLRNICGYRIPPGAGDKASIGNGFLVALAEDEATAREIGWGTQVEALGFSPHDSIVTVRSVVAVTPPIFSSGDRAEDHVEEWLRVMVDAFSSWVHMDFKHGHGHYLILTSPLIARVVAREMTREQVCRRIAERARIPAGKVEHFAHAIGNKSYSLRDKVAAGVIPQAFALSDDPARLVDFFLRPGAIQLIVAGDPERNQSRAYMCNHDQGAPSSAVVEMPADWIGGRT
jgi:hypothetical protein